MKSKTLIDMSKLHPVVKLLIGILFFIIWVPIMLAWGKYQVGINLITGDWVTYSSEQYCYTIKYPGRWRLYVSGDKGWHGGVRPYQRAMILDPKPYTFGGITFRIDQVPMIQPSLEDVADWSLSNREEEDLKATASTLEPFTIDGRPALIRTFSDTSSKTTESYISRETDGLVLSVTGKTRYHEDALKTFQQIVDEFDYWECVE